MNAMRYNQIISGAMSHIGLSSALMKKNMERYYNAIVAGGAEKSGDPSWSVVLFSYLLCHNEYDLIELTASPFNLQRQFEEMGVFYHYKNGSVGNRNFTCSDIIFFMADGDISQGETYQIGLVYRITSDHTKAWMVSVNKEYELYTTMITVTDSRIVGIARPFSNDDSTADPEEDDESLMINTHTLLTEPEIVSTGHVRYVGRVVTGDGDDPFTVLMMGPSMVYKAVPWCPKVFVGNFVEVYDAFADRSPKKGSAGQWLLVRVDKFCCGYIKSDKVVPAIYQQTYASGKILLGDNVYFMGGTTYKTPFTIEGGKEMPNGIVTVIDMNLNSANPYKIEGYNYDNLKESSHMNMESRSCITKDNVQMVYGWVRPDMLIPSEK